jgi:cephalosporin hydroxylase
VSEREPRVRLSTYVLFVPYGDEVEVQHTVRGTTRRIDRATYEDLLRFCRFELPHERHTPWVDAGVLVPPFRDEPDYHGGLRAGTEAKLGRDYQEWYWKREVESEREYRWLGRVALKMPADLFMYQELIVTYQLRRVLEIGHGDGGGLWFFATTLALLGGGLVAGVDRDGIGDLPGAATLANVGVRTFKGDAHDEMTVSAVGRSVPEGFDLVVLDADPVPSGKLALLGRWASLVTPGGILVVEDIESPACREIRGVTEGVDAFLLERRDFGIVPEAARHPMTKARGGVLRRAIGEHRHD